MIYHSLGNLALTNTCVSAVSVPPVSKLVVISTEPPGTHECPMHQETQLKGYWKNDGGVLIRPAPHGDFNLLD